MSGVVLALTEFGVGLVTAGLGLMMWRSGHVGLKAVGVLLGVAGIAAMVIAVVGP